MKTRGSKMADGNKAGSSRCDDRSPQRGVPNWRALPPRLCVSAVILLFGVAAFAQYSIDWHTIDGGGGPLSGGNYSLNGTIGQPDANTVEMTGGSFLLGGGFWAVVAVQTPGAPYLSIMPSGSGQAMISWLPDDPGWVLQQTEDLTSPNWSNSPSMTTNPIVVPAALPTMFYRLFKP